MPKPRVLVSGAGIAGTTIAYWLGKHEFEVVVLERTPSETLQGQIVDVEGPAEEVVRRMGLLDEIKANVTHEAGASLVNSSNKVIGIFPAGQTGVSKEIEIMRPVLARVLLAAADSFSNVEIRYGCRITAVQQHASGISVDIQHFDEQANSTETFDFLIVCDGLRSKTRDLVLPVAEHQSCLRPLNASVAFFNVRAQPQDKPYARCYLAPGRRNATLKPMSAETSSTYLCCAKFDQELHDARESRDVQRQKQVIVALFRGAGWECERLVEGMMETDNFYFEELCQVKLDKWSRGRCVLLGDTAYAPSPLTGQGTNLAILGAYVLAAKLVKQPQQPEKAFAEYEEDIRPYVRKVQPIPIGGYAPVLFNPETTWGIWLLQTIVGWLAWLQAWKYVPAFDFVVPYDLPDL